jgi:PAS domain S-box-containing protein
MRSYLTTSPEKLVAPGNDNVIESQPLPLTGLAAALWNEAAQRQSLRILIVEDSADDARLVKNELRRGGFAVDSQIIETLPALQEALRRHAWDLILSDPALPSPNPLDILNLLHELSLDPPLIIVSDSLNEAAAVELMQAGVHDYILHQDLTRLVPAVIRELREAAMRREQRETKTRLQQAEEKYRAIVENAIKGIYQTSPEGRFLSANQALAHMLGYASPEELVTALTDISHQLYVNPRRRAELQSALEQHGQATRFEVEVYRKDGTPIWVALFVRVVSDATGQPVCYEGIAEDITTRKRAEDALREKEKQYRDLMDSLDGIVWQADARTFQFTFVSQQAERLLGYPVSRWLEEPDFWQDHLHPDDREWVVAHCVAATAAGRAHEFEYRMLTADGRVVWLHDFVSVILSNDQPAELRGVMVNVTARKQAEAQIRQLSSAVEQSPVSIIITDTAGHIEYVNQKFTDITGYAAAEAIGQHTRLLKSGRTSPETYRSLWLTITAGNTWRGELRNRKKNSELFWEQASISPITDAQGRITHFIAIKEDITERKERERELETVARVSAALRGAQTRDEMFPIILDQLLDLLKADGASLSLADSTTGDITIVLGRGDGLPFAGKHIPRGQGVVGHVIESGQPYLTNDAQNDRHFIWPHLVRDHAVACAPLIAQEQVIGALWVGRRAEISREELRLLVLVSNIAANAIHRTSLYEQTQRQVERLAALRAIDIAITSNLDLQATLRVLLEEVTTKLAVDAAAVLLLGPQTRQLEFTAGRGFRSRVIERTRLHLGEGYAGRAALERQRLGIENLMQNNDSARMTLFTIESFEAYYCLPLIAKNEVKGVLEVFQRAPLKPSWEWFDFFETLAGQAVIAIDNALLFQNLQHKNVELTLAYDATIEGWSRALDLRDHETQGHTQRVTEVTIRLAQAMGMDGEPLVHMYRGALLHDIGKMGVPDSILHKPGLLTSEEQALMRRHATYAYEMLAPIAYLSPAINIPYCHHEKWDGTGYPRGLKGAEIPLAARIFAIADVWDALRSNRPYRKSWPADQVRKHIAALSGSHFDPDVVRVFMEIILDDEVR